MSRPAPSVEQVLDNECKWVEKAYTDWQNAIDHDDQPDGWTATIAACGALEEAIENCKSAAREALRKREKEVDRADGRSLPFLASLETRGVKFDFVWWGGAYIEVYVASFKRQGGEIINVWNSAKNEPVTERTQAAFEAKVAEWVETYGPDALVHDAKENW